MAATIGTSFLSFRSSSSSNPSFSYSSSSRAPSVAGFRLRPAAVSSLQVAAGAVRRNAIGRRVNSGWKNFRPTVLPPPRCGSEDAEGITSFDMIGLYMQAITKAIGSDEEAMKNIYRVSFDPDVGFSCHVNEETALKLEGLPGIIIGKPNDEYCEEGGLYVNGEIVHRSPERQPHSDDEGDGDDDHVLL